MRLTPAAYLVEVPEEIGGVFIRAIGSRAFEFFQAMTAGKQSNPEGPRMVKERKKEEGGRRRKERGTAESSINRVHQNLQRLPVGTQIERRAPIGNRQFHRPQIMQSDGAAGIDVHHPLPRARRR